MMEWLRALLCLPPAASSSAPALDALSITVLAITLAGALALLGLGGYFVGRYRRVPGAKREHPKGGSRAFHTLTTGGILVLFVGLWVVGYRQYGELRVVPEDALEVWVVGRQWMWQFESADGLRTEGVLVVPQHRDVRLLLTSRDVIHSFFVPAFRLKQDVVPGMTTSAWFRADMTGSHRVFCAEYCGTRHSRMGASVMVLSEEDYARYREHRLAVVTTPDHTASLAHQSELSMQGRAIAARQGCNGCHDVPALAPSLHGLWGHQVRLEDGTTTDADAAYLGESIMDADADVVAGFRRGSMPSYQGTLEAGDVAALIAMLRTDADMEPTP